MIKSVIKITLSLITLSLLTACNSSQAIKTSASSVKPVQPDRLYVYHDGRMRFNDRYVDAKDVVIYDDGFGGEKAAVKMTVPLHPDYYRDSIRVVRYSEVFVSEK